MNVRQISITTVILLLFAITGSALVALTYDATRERIAANERELLLRKLNQLLPAASYDNALHEDIVLADAGQLNGRGNSITVYRARRRGQPVGVVMQVSTADGYSGTIRMLVGIFADGTLAGVRVVAHRETPGLGDAIDEQRSDWIHQFRDKSLAGPAADNWSVRKDGGDFDQLTGATITSRAVVRAVRDSLLYFQAHEQALFAETANPS